MLLMIVQAVSLTESLETFRYIFINIIDGLRITCIQMKRINKFTGMVPIIFFLTIMQ